MTQTPGAQESPSTSHAVQGLAPGYVPRARQLFVLLACYFTLQVVIRVACSTSTDLDESEAVVLAQTWSWGYGSEGPLYTWLQILVFGVLGQSILGLSLLKNALLLSLYLLTYASARRITRWEAAAVAAALSLFYQPGIAWEAQRDLTHSVLASAFSVATLYCFLRLLATRRLGWYALVGLCAGFGLLTKYNYALWLAGLLLAGISLREFRPVLLNWRMVLTLGLAILIFLPNAIWMQQHLELALQTSSKFHVKETLSTWQASQIGLKNIAQSLLSFAGPIALIYLLIFAKRPAARQEALLPSRTSQHLLWRAWLTIGLVLVCLVVFGHATGFKERWFQPILVALPILAISLVRSRLSPFRLKCMLALTMAVMVAVAIVMPGRLFAAEWLKREEPLTRPYAKLGVGMASSVPAGSLILCDTRLLAGNLRLALPQVTVITPDLAPLFPGKFPHAFLAWDARQDDTPPFTLRDWAKQNGTRLASAEPPVFYSAVYQHHRSRQFRLGLVRLY